MGGSRLETLIKGYISVRVECLKPEKFINMICKNGIIIRNVKRINYTTIEFNMMHNQYRLLRNLVRHNSVKVRIIDKQGIGFLIKKGFRRKFFILGILIFVFIIFSLSSIIWNINIEGNKNVDKLVIYKALNNAGLKQGKIKYGINLREVENSVVKQIEQLSIVNIRIYGTKADVKIYERTMPPKITPIDRPSNIVAIKEGIISKIISYRGQSLVSDGDYVTKNQVLISGVLTDSESLPTKTVHSMGKVMANTWYEEIKTTPINYRYEERSGEVIKSVRYILDGKEVGIKKHSIKFKKYDKIEDKEDVTIASYKLPIKKITTYYYEKVDRSKKLSYDEAYKISLNFAEKDMKHKLPSGVKVVDKKISKVINKDSVTVKLLYILEENIGVEQELK